MIIKNKYTYWDKNTQVNVHLLAFSKVNSLENRPQLQINSTSRMNFEKSNRRLTRSHPITFVEFEGEGKFCNVRVCITVMEISPKPH